MFKHFGSQKNQKTGIKYRMVYDFRNKEYLVQFFGVVSFFGTEDMPLWILLDICSNRIEAEKLLNTLLHMNQNKIMPCEKRRITLY